MSVDLVTEMQNEGARQRRNAAAIRKAMPREPKAKKLGTPERDLQKSIVLLAKRCFPQVLMAAVPNAHAAKSKDKRQAQRFGQARKKEGVVTGFPDLVICLPAGRVLLWELKAPKGSTSAAQNLVHARLFDMGHPVQVIRTIEQAAEALWAALR